VEVIPAQVIAVEHVQTLYGCRNCEQNSNADALSMVKSSVPAPVISGSGIASPSLVAYILCNKYVLALPLNRQEQELQRMNIHISRQTMANWVIFVALKWLAPIYILLHEVLLQGEVSHGDETTLQVIIEEGRKASQNSYMWVYCTGKDADRQVVLFDYQQTRHGKHPLTFLDGYDGYLHVDGYAGYRKLEDQGVILVECWGHLRRKFDEALKALSKQAKDSSPANIGLKYCNQLFEFERKYNEEELSSEERIIRRELETKPIAEAFFAWADSILPQTLPKSKLRQAIVYAINQKPRLMNVFLDGRLEISNNRAERTIRPFAIGRNNWQFAYSEKGAEASAIAYSIVETALANGIVPWLYLNYLFSTLPNISNEQYPDCLPWSPIVQKLCKPPSLNN
jgi:transposase